MSEITNEMKAKCMSEFNLSYEDICPKCVLGDDSPCMCNSDQNGVFTNTRAVPWDLCKQIFKTMYALSPAAAENAALKEENERLKQPTGHFTNLLEENDRLRARVAELEGVLRLALEYWQHRQQRYKNRFPAWVVAAKEALKEPTNEG